MSEFETLWKILLKPETNQSDIAQLLPEKSGFGPVAIDSLMQFASNETNRKMVASLMSSMKIISNKPLVGTQVTSPTKEITEDTLSLSSTQQHQPLQGMRVVFTGKFDGYTRASLHKKCEELGRCCLDFAWLM